MKIKKIIQCLTAFLICTAMMTGCNKTSDSSSEIQENNSENSISDSSSEIQENSSTADIDSSAVSTPAIDYSSVEIEETDAEQFEYTENTDGTLKITNYLGSDLTVGIPETIDGKTVTIIGEYAFDGYNENGAVENPKALIGAITIPDTVKTLEEGAFTNCFSLSYIKLSANLEIIGEGAFGCCDALIDFEMPDTVTEIGSYAFYECWGLSNLKISTNVKSIGEYAFYQCNSLIDVVIPDSVETIGIGTFACCDAMKSITLSNNLTSIPDYLVYECDNIEQIELPKNITSIGEGAFSWTSISTVEIPDNVTSINQGAFFGCTELIEIVIPETVTSIVEDSIGYTLNTDDTTIKIDNGLIIKGVKGSEAENYASANEITFEEK